MEKRSTDSRYRNTVVCVDTYQNQIFEGRMYNPYVESEIPFKSLMEFIINLEKLLDDMNFPQAYEAKRTFKPVEKELPCIAVNDPHQSGKIATFHVKVLFRQNASWQGTVHWLEKDSEMSFRSALELFMLLDSALK